MAWYWGGVTLKEVEAFKETNQELMTGLNNEYAYVYSISLKETEKNIPTKIVSDGAFFDQRVYTKISNRQPNLLSEVTIASYIMAKESDQILKEIKVTNYRMAPNSSLSLPIDGSEDLVSGNYRVQTKVQIGKEEWSFEEEFDVTEEVKKENTQIVAESNANYSLSLWQISIAIVLFILTIILVYIILTKMSNKKRRNSRKKGKS